MFDSGEGGDGDALDGEVEGVDGGGTEECQVEVETEWLVAEEMESLAAALRE